MSTVATMRPAATVFHEEQYFDWRVYALIAVLELVGGLAVWSGSLATGALSPPSWLTSGRSNSPLAAVISLALPLLLTVYLLQMTTEVTPTEVRVWYRLGSDLPPGGVDLEFSDSHAVVEYRPIVDHGGWGIRAGRDGERVLTARGNRGVRLELADGTRLLIGSQRPEELAETIERARRPDVV